MAKLEIELDLKGFGDGKRDISGFSQSLSDLESKLAKAIANSNELEKELISLNSSYKSGSIDQKTYAAEQNDITKALSDTRGEIQKLQAVKNSYIASLKNESENAINASSTYYEVQKRITSLGKEIKNTKGALDSQSPSLLKNIEEYKTLNERLKTFDASLGNFQRNVGNYQSAMKGSNAVSMEFARIIQDAPFGMMGIGNNIQQLTTNYVNYANQVKAAAAAQGLQVGTGTILKGALTGLLSPMSLLTIGISAVTAGWTAYTMWAQKSAKEARNAAKEAKKSADDYLMSLDQITQARLKGEQSAQTEVSTLRSLFSVYTDGNANIKARKAAYEQLQQLYPDYFKNIKFEQTASDATKKAYDELTNSILATARARAAGDLIAKNSIRQLENEQKILDIRKEQLKAAEEQRRIEQQTSKVDTKFGGGAAIADVRAAAAKKVRDLDEQIYNLSTDTVLLNKSNERLLKSINGELDKGAKLTGSIGKSTHQTYKALIDYQKQILEVKSKGLNAAELVQTTGLEEEITKINQKYEGLNKNLDAIQTQYRNKYKDNSDKIKSLDAQTLAARNSLLESKEIEINQKRIDYAVKTAEAIAQIDARSTNEIENNREKDLARVEERYIKESQRYKDNTEVLKRLAQERVDEIANINAKYDKKDEDDRQKVIDKITDIQNKAFSENEKTRKKELDDRIEKVRELITEYGKLLKLQGKDTSGLESMFGNIAIDLTSKATATPSPKKDNTYITRAIRSSIGNVIGQTLSSIEQIGQKNYEIEKKYSDMRIGATQEQIALFNEMEQLEKSISTSFMATIGNVFQSITKGLNDVFTKAISEKLTNLIKDMPLQIGGLSEKISTALVAGASMAGGIISGISKPTSAVGQGIGGALSGAAAGFSIGGPWGAAIGGVIGAIGGIFGASKAKKQEELQKQQLEVQKKQLEEQKRANALAYTSSIIGQMTNQGIITGIDRSAFGDLVAKIEGKDLLLVIDRTRNSR